MVLLKKQGYSSWLTRWYIGFFTVAVIGFTWTILSNISDQIWDKFNYGVSQLGEEMLEELSELRDDLDENDFDSSALMSDIGEKLDVDDYAPVKWTPALLEKFKSGIEQEIIDESVDNHIDDIGFVQINNLISGQLIYQSDGIQKYNLIFIEPKVKLWGYQPFNYKTDTGVYLRGIGHSGVRITKNYFVGLIPESEVNFNDRKKVQQFALTAYEIAEAIDRRADSLHVKDKDKLLRLIKNFNAWAYIYIYEEDRILWASKHLEKSDIYIPMEDDNSDIIVIPREIIPKEYFYDIYDNQGREYRQYTLIYDIIPTYLYKMDLAVPTDSIKKRVYSYAIYFAIGAILLIIIVWVGGNILMRKALRPVDEVIRSVNDITSRNMDKRLPLPKLENEITRLIKTFNELLDRLSRSFQMQKAFIADASHELRTPLSIIIADIETALKNLDEKSVTEKALNNSVNEIERMVRIVDDLNLLARSDSGQIIFNKLRIRLDDILMNTVSRCQVLAQKKKIKLEIKKIEIIEYDGDEELLIRALSNLVFNAIKYSDDNAVVDLSLSKKENTACFKVTDYGIGIKKELQDKIFDRFYRIDSSRSRSTGGSGLGLAIAKWIVEIHAGKINVDSTPEERSTFTIELPL